MSLSKWPPGSHIGFLGFQTLTLIWLSISTPNFSGTVPMYMGRSLLIFSGTNFKMAAWQPYWISWFPYYLVWLWIWTRNFNGSIIVHISRSLLIFIYLNFLNGCLVAILDFFLDSVALSRCVTRKLITSNKTWRTRNAVTSSNRDCEKTTQHFAMMSTSDLFVGYMRSSMAL